MDVYNSNTNSIQFRTERTQKDDGKDEAQRHKKGEGKERTKKIKKFMQTFTFFMTDSNTWGERKRCHF